MNPRLPAALALLLVGCVGARAQTREARWKAHDPSRPAPPVVTPAAGTISAPPPSDALVLFDGRTLDHWQARDGGPPRWKIENGFLVAAPGAGSLVSRESFGDVQLHIEWSAPNPPRGKAARVRRTRAVPGCRPSWPDQV